MTTASRAARVARAIHRACLVLAPAAVRRVYRDEMIATFAAAAEAAAAEGSAAVARLLAHELRDLLRARRVRRSGTRWSVAAEPPIYRPVLRAGWLHGSLWRQAWRSLTRRPAYLAAAVLTLGFGTGVMTAVFSLVDTVLIKPLPHPDADQLVTVYESSPVARERFRRSCRAVLQALFVSGTSSLLTLGTSPLLTRGEAATCLSVRSDPRAARRR
ncbi:MAG TPA: hypothetical protein VF424_00180 [Vicinamibacterales bacterium]